MMDLPHFLSATRELSRSGPISAFVVDMGTIQNIDDPVIRRAVDEYLMRFALGRQKHAARVDRNLFAFVEESEDGDQAERDLAALDEVIQTLGIGGVRIDRYRLPRDQRAFSDRIGEALNRGRQPRDLESREAHLENLTKLLRIDQVLRGADIEPLMHQQEIYDFGRPKRPVAVAMEITVSISKLEDALGLKLQGNDWLFHKVTRLLDRRMLFHLMRDRRDRDAFVINLTTDTILDPDFPDIIDRLAGSDHEVLIVELSQGDRESDPEAFGRAVAVLDRLQVHHAYHAGTADQVLAQMKEERSEPGGFLAGFDFIKLRSWGDVGPPPSDKHLNAVIQAVGPGRLILERVGTEAALQAGLAHGVRMFQGFAITDHVEGLHDKEHARAAAKASRRARTGANKAVARAPEPGGLFTKFLGG